MMVRRRFLRFFRLLVALATIFAAQPSTAASVIDEIVLVGGGAVESDHAVDDESAASEACQRTPRPVTAAPATKRFVPLQAVGVLRERIYLLHCALLR